MTTITFQQPTKRLSLNDRTHWADRARTTSTWRTAACYGALRALGGHRHRGQPQSFVRVTFPVRQNRRRDPHNAIATVKPIVDGLVDAGLWPDDTDEYVIVLDPAFERRTDDIVTVTLQPVDSDGSAAA